MRNRLIILLLFTLSISSFAEDTYITGDKILVSPQTAEYFSYRVFAVADYYVPYREFSWRPVNRVEISLIPQQISGGLKVNLFDLGSKTKLFNNIAFGIFGGIKYRALLDISAPSMSSILFGGLSLSTSKKFFHQSIFELIISPSISEIYEQSNHDSSTWTTYNGNLPIGFHIYLGNFTRLFIAGELLTVWELTNDNSHFQYYHDYTRTMVGLGINFAKRDNTKKKDMDN